MTDVSDQTFWSVTWRTIVSHTVTYFFAGILALVLFDYDTRFSEPPLNVLMRPTDDPLVLAGVLFQPLRGLLFGVVFYLFRDRLFGQPNGWLLTWTMLVFVGILSTFGPTPGSIEGMIYTQIPILTQLGGLIEIRFQSLLLSALTVYWVRHPQAKWLSWVLVAIFTVIVLLPTLGLLTGQARS